jgi:hypothetical protein
VRKEISMKTVRNLLDEAMQDIRSDSQKFMAQISSIRRELMQMGLFDEGDSYMSAEDLRHAGELAKKMSTLLLKWSVSAASEKKEKA